MHQRSAERRRLAKAIFSEACEAPEERRAALLDERCAGDASLRSEVEALLASHDRAGRFMASPDVAADEMAARLTDAPGEMAPPDAEELPRQVGRYKLLQVIGQGGFGTVYMAAQEQPIRRDVALKIIKLGMDTRQVIARFEAERQALALMDHPNIARVLDAGATEAGRPYFVMELVKGVPITEYCDVNKLDARQRLGLFIPVCRAVQHAHQKGIIHRDLKPSNVMVTMQDGGPVAKVIDFGIAKATGQQLTDKTLFTEHKQLIGTPHYMSPEQAETGGLDVDTRSDVYGLGVLMYELLTGTTPFDSRELRSKDYSEVQRVIREVDPPRPSTRVKTLGENATTILARRNVDARELRKLLHGELDWVVMKCLEKDRTRRYDTANDLAADVERYLRGEPVSARPAGVAYRFRKFAGRHKGPVAAAGVAVLALVAGIVGTSWGMFQARSSQKLAKQSADSALLERNAADVQRRQAELSAAAARREAQRATAVSQFMQGIFALAQPEASTGAPGDVKLSDLLTSAAGEIDRTLADQPEEQVLARTTLAEACYRLELTDLAIEQYRRAHDASSRLPGGAESEQTLLLACDLLQTMYVSHRGGGDTAEPLARSTLAGSRRALGELHPVTWKATNALALALSARGKTDESYTLWKDLVERLRDVPQARTANHLGRYYANLAACLRDRGEHGQAVAAMRQATEIILSDQLPRRHGGVGGPTTSPSASDVARDLMRAQRQHLGSMRPDSLVTVAWLAEMLVETGQFDEITTVLEQYVSGAMAINPIGTPTLANRLEDLAKLKLRKGQKAEASELYGKSIAMGRRFYGTRGIEIDTWRDWVMGCSSLGEGWASGTLRDHVWCALDELLRDNVPAKLAAEAADVERMRFTLKRWGAGGDATSPVAAGGLAELKAVAEPEAGMYLLGLEVPRPGLTPLRRAMWLLVQPWEVAVYPINRFDAARSKGTALDGQWQSVISGRPAEQRRATALAAHTIADIVTGRLRRLNWFGVVATTRVELPAGRYRFALTSDDGARMSVDGRQVIDGWELRPSETDDVELELAAGTHEIRVEFFQQIGDYRLWVQVAPMSAGAKREAALLGGGLPGLDYAGRKLHDEVAEKPRDAAARLALARNHARRGRFEEAAEAAAKAIELEPKDVDAWRLRASLLAYLGDETQYRSHCREMLRRFGGSADLTAREAAACASLLMGSPAVGLAEVTPLLGHGAGSAELAMTRGVCEFHAKRYEDAVRELERSVAAAPAGAGPLRAAAESWLAASRHRLGRVDEARAALARAEAALSGTVAGVDDLAPRAEDRVEDWLRGRVARRVAEAVLEGVADPATRPAAAP